MYFCPRAPGLTCLRAVHSFSLRHPRSGTASAAMSRAPRVSQSQREVHTRVAVPVPASGVFVARGSKCHPDNDLCIDRSVRVRECITRGHLQTWVIDAGLTHQVRYFSMTTVNLMSCTNVWMSTIAAKTSVVLAFANIFAKLWKKENRNTTCGSWLRRNVGNRIHETFLDNLRLGTGWWNVNFFLRSRRHSQDTEWPRAAGHQERIVGRTCQQLHHRAVENGAKKKKQASFLLVPEVCRDRGPSKQVARVFTAGAFSRVPQYHISWGLKDGATEC